MTDIKALFSIRLYFVHYKEHPMLSMPFPAKQSLDAAAFPVLSTWPEWLVFPLASVRTGFRQQLAAEEAAPLLFRF
jgi:hypothetical protein